MKNLVYRSPFSSDGRTAAWLKRCKNLSGAYVIQNTRSKDALYIGESHTGRLMKTILRHFYTWDDDGGRKHFTCQKNSVLVAVRLTPPNSASGAQNNLIENLQPKKNRYGYVKEDVGF